MPWAQYFRFCSLQNLWRDVWAIRWHYSHLLSWHFSNLKMQMFCVVKLEITYLTRTNFEVVRFNWFVWNKTVCRVFLSTQQFSMSSGVWIIQPNTFTKCTGVCFNWPVCYIWNKRVCTLREIKLFMPLVRLIAMTHKQ